MDQLTMQDSKTTTVITQTHNNQLIKITITIITRTDKSKGTVTDSEPTSEATTAIEIIATTV